MIGYRIGLPLERALLEQTLAQLSARHPILRTRFELNEYPEPLQLVAAHAPLPCEMQDLRHLPPEQQQRHLEQWIAQEHRRDFQAPHWPWLRVSVHWLGPQSFQLGWSFHHALLDGWSEASLTTEFIEAYSAALRGSRTPARPCRWATATSSPRSAKRSPRRTPSSSGARAARSRFTQIPTTLCALQPPRRAPCEGVSGRHAPIQISARTTARLRTLARELAVPLKSVLLAAHLKALSLACASACVTSGIITHGRPESRDQTTSWACSSTPCR